MVSLSFSEHSFILPHLGGEGGMVTILGGLILAVSLSVFLYIVIAPAVWMRRAPPEVRAATSGDPGSSGGYFSWNAGGSGGGYYGGDGGGGCGGGGGDGGG